MWKLSSLCILLNFALLLTTVCGECNIELVGYPPIFVRNFGSRKVIPKTIRTFSIAKGETLTAYCPSALYISSPWFSNNLPQTVDFDCNENNIWRYKDPKDTEFISTDRKHINIKCVEHAENELYESELILPDCDKYMSYAIGKKGIASEIFAGTCYDIDKLALKYVNFLAQGPSNNEIIINEERTLNLQTVTLDTKLIDMSKLFNFMSPTQFDDEFKKNKNKNPLLLGIDLDYVSLIQDMPLKQDVSTFDYIFNTIWWRSLRLGNWRLYQTALKERIKSVKYNVYMGTSGAITMHTSVCNISEIFSINANEGPKNVPAYIWAYSEALNSSVSNDDFVLIGYNSPFHIYDKTTFCNDMCDEIDWLKTSLFGKTHLISGMGTVICCRSEDVAAKLDNFPLNRTILTPTPSSISAEV